MKILYVGAGFVGVSSATISASSGHQILVYDVDEEKIKKFDSADRCSIESCLFEKGLGDLLVRNQNRVEFTTNYDKVNEFIDNCDAVFMCLPTPEIRDTGESDLSYYFSAAEKLSLALKNRNKGKQEKYIVIVNKSTVPIDMADKTQELFEKAGVKNFGVVANPEFLVEGKAIEGSIRPDRVVIGAWKEKDFEIMRQIYQRFYNSPTVKYIEVNPKEAAASKLLANFMLFNKLAICYDVVGRICESFGDLNFENIRSVLASDPRIGTWGLYNSLYAGGSCFIKDARSLAHQLKDKNKTDLIDGTYLANKRQLSLFLNRAGKEVGFEWKNKSVCILGLAFKRDTNDVRNSPSIEIVKFLISKQVSKIKLYDSSAIENFKMIFKDDYILEYAKNEQKAIDRADVVIIATDWPQFRGVADVILQNTGKPLIMDGRRMLQHRYKELQNAGFDIIAVGSPFIKGKK